MLTDSSSFTDRIGKCDKLTTFQRVIETIVFSVSLYSLLISNIGYVNPNVIINDNPTRRTHDKKMISTNKAASSNCCPRLIWAAFPLIFAIVSGCGQSSESPVPATPANAPAPGDGGTTVPEGVPAAGDNPSASSSLDSNPPGTLVLPDNFDPAAAEAADGPAASPASKEGGFTMPPLKNQSGAQRPMPLHPSFAFRPSTPPNASQYHFAAAYAPVAEVSLRGAKWDEIEALVTKTGRITVVDLWSLACEPCLKEFPGLVRIHRDLGESVACFAVDVDFDGRKTKPAESYRPRVEAFLKSVGATFPNFLCQTASDELFSTLELESIPAVLIFDAKGKLVRKFIDAGDDAGFTYHDNIVPFIKQLLAKSS